MKYQNFILKNNIRLDNSFEYFYKNFIPTLALHSSLVDWKRVNENRKKYNILLNILNSLLNLKEEEFKKDFDSLLRGYPQVVEAFPILLANRENELLFLNDESSLEIKRYVFKKPNLLNTDIINHYYSFVEKTGLKELFCDYGITNLVDYVVGVEVGLSSNRRTMKNNITIEEIVFKYLEDFCNKNIDFELIEKDKFDFTLYNKKENKLYIIETRFFANRSPMIRNMIRKLKMLNDIYTNQKKEVIFIIDGEGWLIALKDLEYIFNHNDYVINLNMLKNGVLEDICLKTL